MSKISDEIDVRLERISSLKAKLRIIEDSIKEQEDEIDNLKEKIKPIDERLRSSFFLLKEYIEEQDSCSILNEDFFEDLNESYNNERYLYIDCKNKCYNLFDEIDNDLIDQISETPLCRIYVVDIVNIRICEFRPVLFVV